MHTLRDALDDALIEPESHVRITGANSLITIPLPHSIPHHDPNQKRMGVTHFVRLGHFFEVSVNQYLILAAADDGLIFDRAHADCMQLPFERGWAEWHVYRRKGQRDLSFIDTFSTFAEALAFIETELALTAEPATAGDYVH